MDEAKQAKILKYETFLNETLKADLKNALDGRDRVYSEISKYLQLRNVIEALKDSELDSQPLKTKIDLGCNFYAKAKVDDPSRICVAVGYGFFLEMTHSEALAFIEKKTKHLNEKSEAMSNNVNAIKANIKLMLEGLREMQNIDDLPEEPAHRNIYS